MAAKRYDGRVVLLSDQEPPDLPCEWKDSRLFRNELFDTFEESFALNPSFRKGLWLRAYERFFTLDQFCREEGIVRGFHAELDTLILDLDGYSRQLDMWGEGLFLPSSEPHSVIASLVYWNSLDALTHLCRFFVDNGGRETEMNALSRYLQEPSSACFSMATEQVWDADRWPYHDQTLPPSTGIVDAAGLGMWLFGTGPKTTRLSIKTKHRAPSAQSWPIEKLRFQVGQSVTSVQAGPGGGPQWPIRSLHVSSKIHRALQWGWSFRLLIALSRLPFKLPLVVRGHLFKRKVLIGLIRRLLRHSKWLPRGLAGLLANFLVRSSNSEGIQIGARLRKELAHISKTTPARGREMPIHKVYIGSAAPADGDPAAPTTNIPNSSEIQSRTIFLSTPSQPRFGATTIPALVAEGVRAFGLAPDGGHADLVRDIETWPIFLSRVLPEEGFLVSHGTSQISATKPLLTNRQQTILLAPDKDLESLEQAKNSLGVDSYAPSWNFNALHQVYRKEHLQRLFPDGESVVRWWKELRTGPHFTTLADYYGVSIFCDPAMRGRSFWLVGS